MSGNAQRTTDAHEQRVSSLLIQNAQALKGGDYHRALSALHQIVEITGPAEAAFPTIGAAEIFAALEPIPYIIKSIDLCPGAPGMWAGYGFGRKTLAAQSAALQLAGGIGRVWDCFAANRARVLHLDYEQGSRLTRERYQRLAYTMMLGPGDIDGWLTLATMPTRYLDHPTAEADLERLVVGYQLAIVDSFKAAAPSIDENSSDARRVLDMLTRISERTGCAFLVIHHARKPNAAQVGGAKMAIRGSGALYDACGSVLVFEAEKGEPTRVSHEKARSSGILTDDFMLDVEDVADGDNSRAGLVVTASTARSREEAAEEQAKGRRKERLEKLTDELRELFKREPEQTGADSMAGKLGRKATDVRGALRVLIENGEVKPGGTTSDRRHQWSGRE